MSRPPPVVDLGETTDASWSLDVTATEGGVDVVLLLSSGGSAGQGRGIQISLDRAGARTFARAVLAAAGDAMERTFREALVDAGRR